MLRSGFHLSPHSSNRFTWSMCPWIRLSKMSETNNSSTSFSGTLSSCMLSNRNQLGSLLLMRTMENMYYVDVPNSNMLYGKVICHHYAIYKQFIDREHMIYGLTTCRSGDKNLVFKSRVEGRAHYPQSFKWCITSPWKILVIKKEFFHIHPSQITKKNKRHNW